MLMAVDEDDTFRAKLFAARRAQQALTNVDCVHAWLATHVRRVPVRKNDDHSRLGLLEISASFLEIEDVFLHWSYRSVAKESNVPQSVVEDEIRRVIGEDRRFWRRVGIHIEIIQSATSLWQQSGCNSVHRPILHLTETVLVLRAPAPRTA